MCGQCPSHVCHKVCGGVCVFGVLKQLVQLVQLVPRAGVGGWARLRTCRDTVLTPNTTLTHLNALLPSG